MLTVDEIDAIARDTSVPIGLYMPLQDVCRSHREALAELGQLQTEFDACRPFLKEDIGETVPECIERNRRDIDALMKLYSKALERVEAADARLQEALSLAKQATNGWACYATREIEHKGISRLHAAIDAARAVLAQKG